MNNVDRTIIFRVDAGRGVGMGHFVRCRSLAKLLVQKEDAEKGKQRGLTPLVAFSRVVFAMRGGDEFASHVGQDGFEYVAVEGGDAERILRDFSPSAVVIDIAKDVEGFLAAAKGGGARTIVIDDLGGRAFGCDLIVNGTAVEEFRRYPDGAAGKMLLGPEYMIMREEFADVASAGKFATTKVGSVFISLGGEDPDGVVYGVIHSLEKMRFAGKVVIALGALFRDPQGFEEMTRDLSCDYETLHNVDGLAAVMRHSDVAIVSGGMTLYELACTGTPGLAIAMNEQQLKEAEEFARRGAVVNMDMWDAVEEDAIIDRLKQLIEDRGLRARMSEAGPRIVDGRGVFRVGQEALG